MYWGYYCIYEFLTSSQVSASFWRQKAVNTIVSDSFWHVSSETGFWRQKPNPDLCQINAKNNYSSQPNYFQLHISEIISRNICLELFPGIYISVWNYFQHACQCLELFPAYMSVSGIISRHISQCLVLFPDIRGSSVWK